jgi:hypothetical protein
MPTPDYDYDDLLNHPADLHHLTGLNSAIQTRSKIANALIQRKREIPGAAIQSKNLNPRSCDPKQKPETLER